MDLSAEHNDVFAVIDAQAQDLMTVLRQSDWLLAGERCPLLVNIKEEAWSDQLIWAMMSESIIPKLN